MKNLSFVEINSENVNDDVMQSAIALYSALIADRVKRFKQKGIHQWQDNYAERNSQENVTQAILNDKGKKLVVFFDSNNNLVGATMVKSQERPGFWDNGEYDQNIDAGYITGLVSDPKFSGQGVGKAIMKEVTVRKKVSWFDFINPVGLLSLELVIRKPQKNLKLILILFWKQLQTRLL